ncbi:hypothetical protein AAFN46_20320 [Pseudomonas sp. CAU 1711]|uniref:hypothetical protein n=1 Tax=Pseudomonas sp. CAU 1711 TaxID=3140356 RepID=UPI003260EAAB
MQDKMEETRRRELANEDRKIFSERENELLSYRELIQQQEKELNNYRSKLKKEQFQREKELQLEFESREKLFADREKQLYERQREFEQRLMQRQAETEALRNHLEIEIATREARLQQTAIELQQEKERYNLENRKKIEETSKDYVSDALDTLETKEKQFHRISKIWSGIGAGSLVVGLIFFGVITITSVLSFPAVITWEFIVFSVFKGVVALTFAAALAKYAFLFSSSYMREALKNADRRHAINFGKFYLESYGAAAEWSQVKEAFEHWNITGENAFSPKNEKTVDIPTLAKAAEIIERVSNSLPAIGTKQSA